MKMGRFCRSLLALLVLAGLALTLSQLPLVAAQTGPEIEVEPGLLVQLNADSATGYAIYFRERPDLSPALNLAWQDRGRFVIDHLQQAAQRSQVGVRTYLDKQQAAYHSFWIDNIIVVEKSDRATFNGLLGFSEIAALRTLRMPHLIEPVEKKAAAITPAIIESNLTRINVDEAWGLGYDGQGIVVGNIDTGVRYTHQALQPHYRGYLGGAYDHNYNWWDPYGIYPAAPADDNGHGSHTMGTMVGGDGGGNQIGLAPGARWIACRGCDTFGCGMVELLECAQFMAAPWNLNKANPNPDLRPHVVNNSWGDCGGSYDAWYQGVVDSWLAAGIIPVFSNGNASNCGYISPPQCNSVANPARYGNVMGVGSTGQNDGVYAPHSNRGPTDNPDLINPEGYPSLKPQVVAPGVDIRSSISGGDGSYASYSGTSMSAPHVAGLIALMWQAGPCLIGDYAATETIIQQTATPITTGLPGKCSGEGPGQLPNQSTGWGEINALAAVQAAAWSCGDSRLEGRVTDAVSGQAIAGAAVTVTNPAQSRTIKTNAGGEYGVTLFAGVHTVTTGAYGYLTRVTSNVQTFTGQTTTLNISLDPAALHTVSGTVSDAATGWPLYARITVSGDPIDPPPPFNTAWTGPATGQYSLTLAEGISYTLKVEAWAPGYLPAQRQVGLLTAGRVENFALNADLVACSAPGYNRNYHYLEDFELDNGGYSHTGTPGDLWQWGAPITWPGGCASGSACWGTNLAGDYEDLANYELVTPVIDLSTLSGPLTARWQQATWLESAIFDQAYAEASINGGDWQTMWSHSGGTSQSDWTEQSYDLSAAAGSNARFRWRLVTDYSVTYPGYYVDQVSITAAGSCLPQPGGLVVGNVYDGNTAAPLAGALVTSDSGGAARTVTTVDPAVDDSFYTLFSPPGSRTFTATLGSYGAGVQPVTVVQGSTVRQDFFLSAGRLTYNPGSLAATVEMGGRTSLPLTLSNIGARGLNYDIREIAGTFSILGSAGEGVITWLSRNVQGEPADRTDSGVNLAYPGLYRYAPDGPAPAGAFRVLVYADDWIHSPPDTLVQQALSRLGLAATVYTGGAYGDFEMALTAGGPWDLVIWSGENYMAPASTTAALLTYLRQGGKLAATYFLQMDLPADPLWAEMGFAYRANYVDSRPVYWWQPDHSIFNIPESAPPWLSRTAPSYNSQGTIIEPLANGVAVAGYTQAAAADQAAIVIRNDGKAVYKAIRDVSTEADADNDGLLDGMELWADIIYGLLNGFSSDVPWLSENPGGGSLASGDVQPVGVFFDAAVPAVTGPGYYTARLNIKTDEPAVDLYTVPVTMTVTAPESYGKLWGLVTGQAACDRPGGPLPEATVHLQSSAGVTWTLTTGLSGAYALWLDEVHSPLTATISHPDYVPQTITGLAVTRQATTTYNIDLRLNAPCVRAGPESLALTLSLGASDTLPLLLTNSGARATGFQVREQDRGEVVISGVKPGHGEWLDRADAGLMASANTGQGGAQRAYPAAYRWQPAQALAGPKVLVYADDFIHAAPGTLVDLALQNLGLAYTAYYDANWEGFKAALAGGNWDLVLVANDWFVPPDDTVWTALDNYVAGGGLLVLHSWTMARYPAHPLWARLGFTWLSDDFSPPDPVYWWAPDHPLFTLPQTVPEFSMLNPVYGVYGQYVQPLAGAKALAGYTTPGPDQDQAALVLANGNRTVFKGFVDGHNSADLDGDSLLDGLELWINLISGIQAGFNADVPWLSESPASGVLPADGGAQPLAITFDTGVLAQPGVYYASLVVDSDDPVNGYLRLPVTMTVEGYSVALKPIISAGSALPGQPATYSLQLVNTGTFTDSFSIGLSGQAWPAVVTPVAAGPLPSGGRVTLSAVVSVPPTALCGARDTALVSAASLADNRRVATATLITTACGEERLFLPLIFKP